MVHALIVDIEGSTEKVNETNLTQIMKLVRILRIAARVGIFLSIRTKVIAMI
jgi:hypothetical protein